MIFKINADGTRGQPMTSDVDEYERVSTKRTFNEETQYNEVNALKYETERATSGETFCKTSDAGLDMYWETKFKLNCDQDGDRNEKLRHDQLSVYLDEVLECVLRVEVTHSAACPIRERKGFA